MYQIEVTRPARKALTRLPRDVQRRVEARIDALAHNPRPTQCEPIKNAPQGTYRIRVGRYRIIYIVLDFEQVVIIAHIRKRGKSTYKRT